MYLKYNFYSLFFLGLMILYQKASGEVLGGEAVGVVEEEDAEGVVTGAEGGVEIEVGEEVATLGYTEVVYRGNTSSE